QPDEGGTISASPLSGPDGTTVTLQNTPAEGYVFSRYTVDGEDLDGDTFTLTKDLSVSGVFTYTGGTTSYDVTVVQPEEGGTISASPLSGLDGTTVTLQNTPAEGYIFNAYIVDGEGISGDTFTLTKDVTVSGEFTCLGGILSYNVTVVQPDEGGTISASPLSGPDGTTVTLQNTPAEGYVFSRYTVDGEDLDGSTLTLTKDLSVSGVFRTPGGSFAYGENTVVVIVDSAESASVSIAGYIPAPDPVIDGSGYTPPKETFSFPADIRSDLAGLSVSVSIENDGGDVSRPSPGTLSLSMVHEVYQALKDAGTADVSIESASLAPLYKGSEWIRKTGSLSADPVVTFYESYADGVELMPGIKIKKFDGRYALEYGRNLVVEDVVYQKRPGSVVYGAGLYKKAGSSAALVPLTGNWADVLIAGDEKNGISGVRYSGETDNSVEYIRHLGEAGLLYAGGNTPSPKHKMNIGSTDENGFSNGMYDFLKTHLDGDKLDRLDNANLPIGYLDGSVFENGDTVYEDGLPVVKGPFPRRLSTGHYNPAFPGNVPVNMLNTLGCTIDCSNVNIIGDGGDFNTTANLRLANVSLVGDYSTVGMTGYFYGLFDIEGNAPTGIENNTNNPSAYFTIWNAASNTQMNNFAVLHVRPTALVTVQKIGAHNSGYQNRVPLQAIVLEHRIGITKLGVETGYASRSIVPTAYRAVLDTSTGIYKFVGGTAEGFSAETASDTDQPVPSIDPEEWRAAGNAKAFYPQTSSWSSIDAGRKWNYGENGITMLRGAGPRLVDAALPRAWLVTAGDQTALRSSLGFDPWAGPTTPLCSISSTRRAARL
ncbi:MAG: hypothetical protein LBP27_02040, partial [Treponema sp.]|nr:hypothetical protein [Treponema sp.]